MIVIIMIAWITFIIWITLIILITYITLIIQIIVIIFTILFKWEGQKNVESTVRTLQTQFKLSLPLSLSFPLHCPKKDSI